MGNLAFDYSSAKGGSSANPLASTGSGSSSGSGSGSKCNKGGSGSSTGSGTATTGSSATTTDSNQPPWASYFSSRFGTATPTGNPFGNKRAVEADDDDSCDEDGSNSSNGFGQDSALTGTRATEMLMAHGILACLAFAVLFPIGGIIIRILSFPGLIWLHAAMQVVAYIMFIAAFGLGVYIANNQRMVCTIRFLERCLHTDRNHS